MINPRAIAVDGVGFAAITLATCGFIVLDVVAWAFPENYETRASVLDTQTRTSVVDTCATTNIVNTWPRALAVDACPMVSLVLTTPRLEVD